jgi:hypothetical protein
MISEVTKLVSNDNNNSFKLPLSLFLEDTNYDDINQTGGGGGERETCYRPLLYNQGKTYREISKVARISPSDIGVILNKIEDQRMERRATK